MMVAMKNKKIWLVWAALGVSLIGGCAQMTPNEGRRVSKYTPAAPPSAYGDWYIDSYSCTIRARAQDFTLVADPVPYKGTLKVKALFIAPQVQPPTVDVSELLVPVPVEGTSRGYSIILAYDSVNAAHMMKADTYMMVRYQPMDSAHVLESSFQTKGLMFALADVANYCEP